MTRAQRDVMGALCDDEAGSPRLVGTRRLGNTWRYELEWGAPYARQRQRVPTNAVLACYRAGWLRCADDTPMVLGTRGVVFVASDAGRAAWQRLVTTAAQQGGRGHA